MTLSHKADNIRDLEVLLAANFYPPGAGPLTGA